MQKALPQPVGRGGSEGKLSHVGAFGQTFELEVMIASGSSASVYRCVEKSAGRQLACKLSRREDTRWPWNHVLDLYEREAMLLRHVQGHPNVVQLAGLYKEPNRIYMVMELVRGGDLHTVLTKQRCLPEEVARAAFTQLVSAVDHLHGHGVLHRDIKLENVLYDQQASPPVIKLCDLGNSMLVEQPPSGNFKGTNGYTAPEVTAGATAHWTAKADVWALGVVLYAMLGGYLPFDDTRGRHSAAQFLDFSNAAWWDISVEAKLLIQSMLAPELDERATLDDVIDSAWLARVDPLRLPTPVVPPPLHPVSSMPVIADVITRLSLRSYRKPSANNLAPGGGGSASISEDEVSCAALHSAPSRQPAEGGMGGGLSAGLGRIIGGMGLRRNGRGSASCNNIASMGAASHASAMGAKPFGAAAVGAAAADKPRPDAANGGAGGEGGGAEQDRLKGMRMSLSAAQGIASRPMEQQ